ncbi:MAG: TetR/AcrR family transcriptional regulator [Sandaracinaceae bacterium]|nr:TetR/AcrR family transcriptional regulator [Sandaracinaceae bacterium]
MCARPVSVSDAQIFEATFRAIHGVGFPRLTLTAIAGEAGLSEAALIKRFGTKTDLLRAMLDARTEALRAALADVASRPHPMDALRALMLNPQRLAGRAPAGIANGTAFFAACLGDPELAGAARARAQAVEDGVRALLRSAQERGELRSGPVDAPARAFLAVMYGAPVAWAGAAGGSLEGYVRDVFDHWAAPLRLPRAARGRASSRRGS